MNMYRLTIPDRYLQPGCPGHTNPSARQGRYVEAESPIEAIEHQASVEPKVETWDVQTGDDGGKWEDKPATRYSKHGCEWRETATA